ncbi:exodeoxyribonuclease VII small subunit [Oscillospiraceae bacterium LCP25S3_E10]|nr:exodeoxyribonuclease VII small subunit [Ruminococcus sp.]MDD6447799.1 exodeoxyribonuclease VII small subunit [Ruminococcus sp.]MDY2855564.1 exodeoxyribonuclease VII small subunit [Oscillospiraceae bacterium]
MPKKKTYEEAIARLEEITDQLEKGGIPLEKSLKLFEEGTKLSAYCYKILNEAQQKVTELSTDDIEKEAAE